MTALLDRAIARVRALPDDEQDVFASLLLTTLDPESTPPLDDATRRAIREGLAQAERGDFADQAEIDALLADRRAAPWRLADGPGLLRCARNAGGIAAFTPPAAS